MCTGGCFTRNNLGSHEASYHWFLRPFVEINPISWVCLFASLTLPVILWTFCVHIYCIMVFIACLYMKSCQTLHFILRNSVNSTVHYKMLCDILCTGVCNPVWEYMNPIKYNSFIRYSHTFNPQKVTYETMKYRIGQKLKIYR